MPELRKNFPKEHTSGYFASGGTKSAYHYPKHPDKIYTIAHQAGELSTENAQIAYYAQKILHELFPNNFPALHAAFNGSKKSKLAAVQVREKVVGPIMANSGIHGLIRGLMYLLKDIYSEEGFQTAAHLLGWNQLPIDRTNDNNFVMGKKGIAYLDVNSEELSRIFNASTPEKLLSQITKEFGAKKAEKLEGAIKRLYGLLISKNTEGKTHSK